MNEGIVRHFDPRRTGLRSRRRQPVAPARAALLQRNENMGRFVMKKQQDRNYS